MKIVTRGVAVLALVMGIFSMCLALGGSQNGLVYAGPSIIYVAADGECGGNTPCYATIQEAVDAATSEEIHIAAGTYTSSGGAVVTLEKSLVLRGGYASDFSTRDVETYASVLDGETSRRVISLDHDGLTVTLDGLHITRGHNGSSSGGGVRDYTGNNTLTIQGCRIYQNVANISGGGVFIGAGTTATLTANEIYSNTAEGGNGGGVAVAQNTSLTMTSNKVYGNLVDWDASGGGVAVGESVIASLTLNQIYDNHVGENGGGVSVGSASVITATYNTVRYNEAGTKGTAHGGGFYLYEVAEATLIGNSISSNKIAGRGGGVGINGSDHVLLSGNTFLKNQVTQYDGGAIYVTQSSNVQLVNNIVGQNTAVHGGGVYVSSSPETRLEKMTIYDNTAEGHGGGLYVSGSNGLMLQSSHLYSNTARDTEAMGGGIAVVSSKRLELVNTIIADNTLLGTYGAGLAAWGEEFNLADVTLIHTTLARNTGSDGSGVYVSYGTAKLTNTILVSHTFGVYADTEGEVSLESTLWGADAWANDSDHGGAGTTMMGTHNYTGTPDFLNAAAGDYHIGTASAARNMGVDVGVTTDIDGDARPFEGQPDLGADELAYSLSISKDAPAKAAPGEVITYTLTITNNGYLTLTNVVITDALPVGATFVGGSTSLLPSNILRWWIPHLAGHKTATVQFKVMATETIVNEDYGVVCDEGAKASGAPVTTTVSGRVYLPLILRIGGL